MKMGVILAGLLAILAGNAIAASQVVESPFELNTGYTTGPASIACSSFTWTTMGTPVDGTFGTFFKNLETSTGTVHIIATSSSSAPSASTGAWTWSLAPTSNAMYVGSAGARVYFWCTTSYTATETATVTQVRPVR